MERKIINLPLLFTQRILKNIGLMDSTLLGNDLYYCLRIVEMFKNQIGEEKVKKMLKDDGYDWDSIKSEIKKINKIVQEIKPLYDLIEDKTFSKFKTDSKSTEDNTNKKKFIKLASKIPLFDNKIIFMYVWFVKNTNLQNQQVKAQDYKILEQSKFRPMDIRKQSISDISSGVVNSNAS